MIKKIVKFKRKNVMNHYAAGWKMNIAVFAVILFSLLASCKSIKTENIPVDNLEKNAEGFISRKNVLPGEVAEVSPEYIAGKGSFKIDEQASTDHYDVLYSIKGNAMIVIDGQSYPMGAFYIARIPYNKAYTIHVGKDSTFYCLRMRKSLDDADRAVITKDMPHHSEVYIKAIKDCPTYSEDIKSAKTISRMLLPEGMVPRFCMGTVETAGPDKVGEHKHPMLDQLFMGIEGCECKVFADGKEAALTENMLLHIPLASNHHVEVESGKKLAYIWMDFFQTLEGQKYMNEQHHMNNDTIKKK
jgi:glyoxylate utilization-related uncharacterized protein